MSWEEIGKVTKSCPCGKGTVTYREEMDDWNRVRVHKQIECAPCKEVAEEKERQEEHRKEMKASLFEKARHIAEERYITSWLTSFNNLNKREVWLKLTGGNGYPSLGTFYKHVKEEGLTKYLNRIFSQDFPEILKREGVDDKDIEALLKEGNNI